MLVTLAELKTFLGITGATEDDWLTQQEALISETVENYCGRKFLKDEYVQTFYESDINFDKCQKELLLFHYPIIAVSEVLDDTEDVTADVRIHKPTGLLTNLNGFFQNCGDMEITYEAGFEQVDIPGPVKSVIMSLIQERYSKKQSGVSLNFGSDVQRVSIPGTISVDFDYSLQSNQRSSAFGTILGSYGNVLDAYRSERAIIGSGSIKYVEEAP